MAARKQVGSISRKELLDALSLTKPALGKGAFVPVLSHFCIDGEHVTAYDDMIAISVEHPLPVQCAVPADMLLRLLGSLSSDDMTLTLDNSNLVVACGRSRLKVPALGPDAFIFKRGMKPRGLRFELGVTDKIVDALKACLVSVGADPTHPAQMGVTVTCDDGSACFYSTDNTTLSVYELPEVTVDFEEPVILPTAFCRNLVALYESDRTKAAVLRVYEAEATATFDDWGLLYGKLPANEKPLDFAGVVERLLPKSWEGVSSKKPEGWEAIFERAQACADPARPVTELRVEDGTLHAHTASPAGESTDHVELSGKVKDCTVFHVDPVHVARMAERTRMVVFGREVLVLAQGKFAHLISHCVVR